MLLGSVWDGDLLAVATSPDLMLATLAMLNPPIHTGEAFELLVCHGAILSQIPEHFVHLIGIDGGVIPTHTVASLDKVATDLPVSHAANELIPWGLQTLPIGHTCLSSVVEEFIVADPEGSVPGLVICPTVHGVVCCVDVVSLQAAPLSGGR